MEPTSEQAVREVGSGFGVGRTVAINRLHHVFGLSASQREAMERRLAEPYRGEFDADQPPEPLGFRGQPLVDLVRLALEAGAITKGRARSILGIASTEPLELPDLVARDSLVTPENRAIRTALAWLDEPEHQLVPGMPERDGSAWQVRLFDGGIGGRKRRKRGALRVGPSDQQPLSIGDDDFSRCFSEIARLRMRENRDLGNVPPRQAVTLAGMIAGRPICGIELNAT